MTNDIKLRDVYDSLDLAVLAVKIEDKYKVDVFRHSIPETFGELRERLTINRNHPLFHDLWQKFMNKEPITCYTSGTTGEPKAVTHPYEFWERHCRKQFSSDVWGLCYDPSHIAGIFVILQAFHNNCDLILLYNHENPGEEITENSITHLSASSTFYRMLPGVYPSVQRVTVGSMRPIENLNRKFPRARIRNIYATTEHGVIGSSDNEWYDFKPGITVTDDHELVVDGVPTGDIVAVNHDRYFIRGRRGQFANIGGEKVYYDYVETMILEQNPSIRQLRIYARENSITGQILMADVVTDDVTSITCFGLSKHETPIFNPVDKIQTVNGKVKR